MLHLPTRHAPRRIILFAMFASLAACTSDSNETTTTTATQPSEASTPATSTEVPPATDSSAGLSATAPGLLTVLDNTNNVLSARLEFELEQPAIVAVTAVSGDHVVEVPPTSRALDAVMIPLVGLRSERTYAISAALTDVAGEDLGVLESEFTSGAIPERFVPIEIETDPSRTSPGYTIVEMQELRDPASATPAQPFDEFQYLIALDDEGEVVWYYENGVVIGAVEQTTDGTFTSIYWPNGVREFDMLGNEVADWIVPLDDQATADVETVIEESPDAGPRAPGLDAVEAIPLVSDDFNLIHHEAQRTVDGNYLALSATSHDLTDEQRSTFCPDDDLPFSALSDVAVEFTPEGEILRTWDLWDVIDIDAVPGEEMCNAFFAVDGARDWTHANAVVYDAERDAVIFSARHTSQVVAMRHGDDLGPQTELLWTFGDNGTLPLTGDGPRYQHAVEVQDDGSILLYDNGNGRPGTDPTDPENPPYSRAVLYDVDDRSDDPAEWQVTQLWEHRTDDIDGEPLFASFIGDADRLSNGNVLITHGGADFMNPTSFLHTRIIEVVPDGAAGGDIVWQLDAGSPEQTVATYRAERIDSFYVGPMWAQLD